MVNNTWQRLCHKCVTELGELRTTNSKLCRFPTDCTYRLRERFVRNRSRD